MVLPARLILILYMLALAVGCTLALLPRFWPEEERLLLTLLGAQLSFPLYLWITWKLPWTAPWRTLRVTHGIVVLLLLLFLVLAFLTTPDVSGFRS